MFDGKDETIDRKRSYELFYYTIALSIQSYTAYSMVFMPRTKNMALIVLPVLAAGYMAQKLDYHQMPFEKHLSWLGFNVGWGAMIGAMAMQNKVVRNKYMEFFALWGYAMFYISALIFKMDHEGEKITENDLVANSMGLTLAAALYGTGLLKMAGFDKNFPNWRLFAALGLSQTVLMTIVVMFLSKQVQLADNPIDGSLEYQWRSVP